MEGLPEVVNRSDIGDIELMIAEFLRQLLSQLRFGFGQGFLAQLDISG